MSGDHRIVDGRYRLGGRLGRGGMADVHFALDTRLCRPVAVKMLRRNLARDPAARELFEREAWSVASLSHPAIVGIFDTGDDIDPTTGISLPYLVMEFVPGSTLQTVLAGEQKLAPRRALRLMRGVVAALAYSHASGIVHRDIKPSNVMVAPTGEVKVMDFGIAGRLADTTAGAAATVLGTAKYLSPERARGEDADARSDLYSAGCLLYELLVGTPPFTAESPLAIAARHLHDVPVPPSELVEGVSPEVDAVVLRALAKDPADRFQSAEEMGAALENVLAGRRAFAAAQATSRTALQTPLPRSVVRQPAGSSRRRRALLAGVVAVLFPIASVAGYDVIRPGAAQTQVAAAPLALETTIGRAADARPAPVRRPLRRTEANAEASPDRSSGSSDDLRPDPARSSAPLTRTGPAVTTAQGAPRSARPTATRPARRRGSTSAAHTGTAATSPQSTRKVSTARPLAAHEPAATPATRTAAPRRTKVVRPTRAAQPTKRARPVVRPVPSPRPAPPAAPPVSAPTPRSGHHGSGHSRPTPKPKASPTKNRSPEHGGGKGRGGRDDHKGGTTPPGQSHGHGPHAGGGGSSGSGSHSGDRSGHEDHSGHGGGKGHGGH